MVEELNTYPTNAKMYDKIRIIGQGAFAKVNLLSN